MKNKIDPWKHFEKNSDFLLTRKEYPQEFMNCYNQGMDCFIRGNWHKAKEFFETAEVSRLIFIVQGYLRDKDKSIQMKLQYMKNKLYHPDDKWDGYREETEEGH